ncbi:hypothetical protein [Agrobacterium tumefaciens]|uniref:hypothetical protein n=1 Tax=Agrobacterium tumefaciens TaxID=358 RepID=UPI001572D3DE|nr:hypothetical protein [Agrobacterium tumefaciens]NTE35532.1 hypothetical protein [Agrobacterium tumefaciens]NTE51042.1 hypothetical protein [Agrobacterium tumefaciens]
MRAGYFRINQKNFLDNGIALDDWHFFGIVFASVVGGDPFRIRRAGKIGFRLAVAFAKSNLA